MNPTDSSSGVVCALPTTNEPDSSTMKVSVIVPPASIARTLGCARRSCHRRESIRVTPTGMRSHLTTFRRMARWLLIAVAGAGRPGRGQPARHPARGRAPDRGSAHRRRRHAPTSRSTRSRPPGSCSATGADLGHGQRARPRPPSSRATSSTSSTGSTEVDVSLTRVPCRPVRGRELRPHATGAVGPLPPRLLEPDAHPATRPVRRRAARPPGRAAAAVLRRPGAGRQPPSPDRRRHGAAQRRRTCRRRLRRRHGRRLPTGPLAELITSTIVGAALALGG